ncbi:MAG TPA: M56 family metallopeptidase [Longimicrobiaceae bacterium]|jgi:beta-lactamase regulating signal transducer with metallopeptidase domain|nr:M56 family metallopeptidase [Longimicrobiaceae bacterium]
MAALADVPALGWLVAAGLWLATYTVHSTLALGGAWLLVRFRAVRGERGADLLWKAALLGGIATATVQSAAGFSPLGGRIAVRAPSPVPAEVREFATVTRSGGPGARPVVRRWREKAPAPPLPAEGIAAAALALAWAGGAAFRLARFGRAHARLRRLLAGRREMGDDERRSLAGGLWIEAAGGTGIGREMRVTVSDVLPAPVALGVGEVCLPERVLREMTPAQQRGIVAHEAAHLARRDPLWLHAFNVVGCVCFFQPLNALALRRFREGAELLCDAEAARATGRPRELARSLAQVAAWLPASGADLPLPAMIEGGSPFVRRVERLVAPPSPEPRSAAWRAVAAASVLLLAVAAGAPSFAVRAAVRQPVRMETEVLRRLRADRRPAGIARNLAASPDLHLQTHRRTASPATRP